jgi:hypothetical protein
LALAFLRFPFLVLAAPPASSVLDRAKRVLQDSQAGSACVRMRNLPVAALLLMQCAQALRMGFFCKGLFAAKHSAR